MNRASSRVILAIAALFVGCAPKNHRYTYAHQFQEEGEGVAERGNTITRIETDGTKVRLENDLDLILVDVEKKYVLEGDRQSRTFKPGTWKAEPMCEHMGDHEYLDSECKIEFGKGGETKLDCKATDVSWTATGKIQSTDLGIYEALYQAEVLPDVPYCSLRGLPFDFSALHIATSGKEGKSEQHLSRTKIDRTCADISRF